MEKKWQNYNVFDIVLPLSFEGYFRFYSSQLIIIIKILKISSTRLILKNQSFKANFYKYVYDRSFKFSDVLNIYHKYFDGIKRDDNSVQSVASDKISYSSIEKYNDGAKLMVGTNYAVPILESGIVVYKGEKDNYGNVIIIQQINGIDMWYGNISDSNVKLYDYVTKGSILGNCNDYLYVVFKKDGNVLPYEENL